MEDQIISALNENPCITGGQLLAMLPKGTRRSTVNGVALVVFQRIARNEHLMPPGMTFESLARLLDQLIAAAKNRGCRAKVSQRKEQGRV